MRIHGSGQTINTTSAYVVLPVGEMLNITCVLADGSHRLVTVRVGDIVSVQSDSNLETLAIA